MQKQKSNNSEEAKQMMSQEAPAPGQEVNVAEEDYSLSGMDDMQDDSMGDPQMKQSVMEQESIPPQKAQQEPILQPAQAQQTIQPLPQTNYSATSAIDEIEELVESVVEEKWRSLMENFGNIGMWKEKVRTDLLSIKQELVRIENRFENLQKAVLGRIQGYDKNITDVGSEVRALEKVLEKILNPLTTNIKELTRITEKLKK